MELAFGMQEHKRAAPQVLEAERGLHEVGDLEQRTYGAAAQDDVEDRELAVPAVQHEEGTDGEKRRGHVYDACVDDVDRDGGDEPDDAYRDAEQERPDAWVLRDRDEPAVQEDRLCVYFGRIRGGRRGASSPGSASCCPASC